MTGTAGGRTVTICLNRARLWRWQHELVTRLARRSDIDPVVRLMDGPPPSRAFTLLLMLENFAFRLHDEHACDLIGEKAFEPYLTGSRSERWRSLAGFDRIHREWCFVRSQSSLRRHGFG